MGKEARATAAASEKGDPNYEPYALDEAERQTIEGLQASIEAHNRGIAETHAAVNVLLNHIVRSRKIQLPAGWGYSLSPDRKQLVPVKEPAQ